MERISALMDDELEEGAIDSELDDIKRDPQREEVWSMYHLIGDSLRGQGSPVLSTSERIRVMLENEPTVLAPRPRKSNRAVQRVALPLAASVCGIAVVAWLALSNNSAISPTDTVATQPSVVAAPEAVRQVDAPATDENGNDGIDEYLMAHQQFSPSTAIQGVVPYVRTVSSGDRSR